MKKLKPWKRYDIEVRTEELGFPEALYGGGGGHVVMGTEPDYALPYMGSTGAWKT